MIDIVPPLPTHINFIGIFKKKLQIYLDKINTDAFPVLWGEVGLVLSDLL